MTVWPAADVAGDLRPNLAGDLRPNVAGDLRPNVTGDLRVAFEWPGAGAGQWRA